MAMADYLSAATPNYSTETLSIIPNDIMSEDYSLSQDTDEFVNFQRTIYTQNSSASTTFKVILFFDMLSSSDYTTITDLYFNSAKANQTLKSFLWEHPTDGYTYVVRFDGKLDISRDTIGTITTNKITLKVLGYYSV